MDLEEYNDEIRCKTDSMQHEEMLPHTDPVFKNIAVLKEFLADDDLQEITVCSTNIGFVRTFTKSRKLMSTEKQKKPTPTKGQAVGSSDLLELKSQVAALKIDQQVTAVSSTYHIKRCRLLEQANEDANALIGDISNELGAIVQRQAEEICSLRSNDRDQRRRAADKQPETAA